MDRLLRDFYYPFMEVRNRAPGYAVSIVKAGLTAIGRNTGFVRPPLSELSGEEMEALTEIVSGYQ